MASNEENNNNPPQAAAAANNNVNNNNANDNTGHVVGGDAELLNNSVVAGSHNEMHTEISSLTGPTVELDSEQPQQQQQGHDMTATPAAAANMGSPSFLGRLVGFVRPSNNGVDDVGVNNDSALQQQQDMAQPLLSNSGDMENNNNGTNNNETFETLDIDDRSNTTMTSDKYSLAYAPTTLMWRRILVSVWALTAHVFFFYGQTSPMWHIRASMDVDITIQATTTLSQKTFDALGLNHTDYLVHMKQTGEHPLPSFTYWSGIHSLWKAAGLGNPFLPRLSAIILILASGVWPHLKLLLLHVNWFLPVSEKRRTTRLYWLGTFGKYSLADIFLVCVLIAIININWNIDPVAIKKGVIEQLPAAVTVAKEMYTPKKACAELTGYPCNGNPGMSHQLQCWACEAAVNEAYNHPDWAQGVGKEVLRGVKSTGSGTADLKVGGLYGTYFFCAGVILSLFLSVYVDSLDHKARSWTGKRRRLIYETASASGNSNYSPALELDTSIMSDAHRRLNLKKRVPEISTCLYISILIGAFLAAFIVSLGTVAPTMRRECHGAFPNIARDVLGLEWSRDVSLTSLGKMTGFMGGWDNLLEMTFMLFLVFGPILRGVLCVIYLLVPMRESAHLKLLKAIDFVGAFCAWEVFYMTVFLVQFEVPTITNTIYRRKECVHYSDDGSCFKMSFDLLKSSFIIVLGGILLVVVSIFAVKIGYYGLDPYDDGDRGGPYCGCCEGDEDDGDVLIDHYVPGSDVRQIIEQRILQQEQQEQQQQQQQQSASSSYRRSQLEELEELIEGGVGFESNTQL